ncbi:MAG: hypothetical protein RR736_23980 [Pseudomonas sp.]|uniref:hypothetical protein n=1 Tax=Pseudomonas sp. TaxID=306 RepID=UPI002FC60E63
MNNDVISKLKSDPDNAGSVLGWGVVRNAPWHLQGVYESKEEAQAQAKIAGDGYSASYGSYVPGTDNFTGGLDE